MSVDYMVNAIYDEQIRDITSTQEKWKSALRLAGRIYRFEFDNILMVYAQRPNATLVADYDTWKRVGRYVRRGSKGIAIFPSRALLRPTMRYVFDHSDTGGKNVKLTWDMDKDTAADYLSYLDRQGTISLEEGFDMSDNSKVIKEIKSFTKENIRGIIREDFRERMSELTQLSGSVIKEFSEKRNGSQQPEDMEAFIKKCILYVVGTRCGFDLSVQEQDLSQIVSIHDEEIVYRLGSIVCDVSCSVLKNISQDLKKIESERRVSYGKDNTGLRGEGRTALSGNRIAGAVSRPEKPRQVRQDGDELSQGERADKIPDTSEVREVGWEDAGSGQGSERSSGQSDGGLSKEEQANESIINNGDVEDQRTGEDAGGRDSTRSDRDEVPLKDNDPHSNADVFNEELNRELKELDSFGKPEEAGQYRQASFFDAGFALEVADKKTDVSSKHKFTYVQPKTEPVVPNEYIRQVVLRGTGFVGGKGRVCEIFENELSASERAKKIKNEYGQGGAGWPLEGYGLHGYDTFHGKGIRFQWRDEEGEKEGYVSWRSIEKEISLLILTGEYQPETPKTQEVEDDSVKEVSDQDSDGFDDYAIPDEPDSYNRSLETRELTEAEEATLIRDDEVSEKEIEVIDNAEVVSTDDAVTQPLEKHDYHYNLWEQEKGGAKTRFRWNMDATKLLKQIEQEDRLATHDEQKILAKYVGWGGLAQAFDGNNESWKSEYEEVKELLTEKEYATARATVNNAFYTPPEIAACMGQALVNFGFRSGNLLEPAMGIGNFFGSIPDMMKQSNLYGVELDDISGRIAKQLYQSATINIKGFEETDYPDNFFDVVIGNVPFGDYKLFDPKYNKFNFRIHDYFIAKALDQVRPGGMVAVITTKGTLDKQNPSIRRYIAERAELVGAIRLPNTAFKDSAGTEVTSDILFLQKRERKIAAEPDWVHLGYTQDGIPVNSYFADHPEMMLGRMEYDRGRFGNDSNYTTCVNDDENFNLYEALNNAIKNIQAEITDFERISDEEEQMAESIPADPDVRNYTYSFADGKLYYRENSQII